MLRDTKIEDFRVNSGSVGFVSCPKFTEAHYSGQLLLGVDPSDSCPVMYTTKFNCKAEAINLTV